MIREFREFAMRGNVLDMAVGIIIGGAFGTVVKSMVDDMLMPPIGLAMKGVDFKNLYVPLTDKVQEGAPLDVARGQGAVIAYGSFINAMISFVIVAFALFIIIKAMNTAKKRFEREQAAGVAPVPPDVVLLTEIRDLLKRQG
ncbi:MAG: large conductance mechanosensitive channel protein MscL [Phycisphaerales bacterium]|nr:large conductance mechanosensitive channel protein MscL [Phycisphaerales bacterium]